jgi:DNA-binding transcriptional ArsR family regulator
MSRIKDTQTEILLVLHNIEDRLQEIAEILRMGNIEAIESAQRKILGSPVRKRIYELCDGEKSVSDIANELKKSIQQVSNNITLLQKAGLVREIRVGKEKRYLKTK